MRCVDCEQLFDAYLDGQLSGSLRIEFDAHRLRCARCQQTLAMLEAVTHVVSNDPVSPPLAEDFTDRVMRQISQRQASRARPRRLRIALAIGGLLQAAAVLTFAIVYSRSAAPPTAPSGPVALVEAHDRAERFDQVHRLVVERVEERIWDMYATGATFTSDVAQLARYLDVRLPEDVARASEHMASVNPWMGLLQAIVPAAPADESLNSGDSYSL